MAHVEDRWWTTDTTGKRVKTDRHGSGSRWRAVWHELDGTRRRKAFPTKDAAVAHLADVEVDARAGTYISPDRGRMALGAYAATWLDSRTDLKPTTHARTAGVLRNHVLPAWGATALADITPSSVQAWANGLPGAPGTVDLTHGVLAQLLDDAVRHRLIPSNPARGTRLPAKTKREHRFLTVDELTRLLNETGEWTAITRCLALTGMRVGEVGELRVRDVDLERGRFTVRRTTTTLGGRRITGTPKTSAGNRSVAIPGPVRADVAARLAEADGRDDLMYPTPRGAQLNKDNYRRAFNLAAARAGLTGVRPHDLRHTAVSLAVRSGASVKAVQRMVGHASAAITLDVYAGLFDDELDDVAARIGALMEPPHSPQGSGSGP